MARIVDIREAQRHQDLPELDYGGWLGEGRHRR